MQILSVYRFLVDNSSDNEPAKTVGRNSTSNVQALRLLGNVHLSIVLQILRRINMCMG